MFERFTDRARRVVVLAQEEARHLDHNYIGTEHLLAGLVGEGEGIAGQVLSKHLNSIYVRSAIENRIGRGSSTPRGHIPFTPRSKKVLELSLREALQFGHNYIGTEHLLLGILREGEGKAIDILSARGVSLDALREEVVEALGGTEHPPVDPLTSDLNLVSSHLESAREALKRIRAQLEGKKE